MSKELIEVKIQGFVDIGWGLQSENEIGGRRVNLLKCQHKTLVKRLLQPAVEYVHTDVDPIK